MEKLIKTNASGRREAGASTRLVAVCLVGALALLVCSSTRPVASQEQLTVESRQQREPNASENELADTINYLEKLEKLDKYWSELARPRFGRSEYKQRRASWPQQPAGAELERAQQQQQQARQLADPNPTRSILELLNARMAQRYRSNAAY